MPNQIPKYILKNEKVQDTTNFNQIIVKNALSEPEG